MRRALAVPCTALALALAGCGSGDEGGGGGSGAGSAPAPGPEGAEQVRGTGYSFAAPEGYRDVTSEANGSAVRIDKAVAKQPEDGFATNVTVIRETPPQVPGLDEVARTFEAQVEATTGEGVDQGDTELAGEPAKTQEGDGPNDTHLRQVFTVSGDAVYTITFTTKRDRFGDEAADFDAVLSSFRFGG